MKRPSDWPLHFVLYPMIFRICPAPILAIIQEMSKVNRGLPRFLSCSEKRSIICFAGMNMDYTAKLSITTDQRAGSILFPK